MLFCSVFLPSPLVVSLCDFRRGAEFEVGDWVPGGLECRGLFHPLVCFYLSQGLHGRLAGSEWCLFHRGSRR